MILPHVRAGLQSSSELSQSPVSCYFWETPTYQATSVPPISVPPTTLRAPMRLAPQPLRIGKTEGFTEQYDMFGASQRAERFADLVSELEGHSVIVIDGDWGSGKSTFIKQWAGMMRKRDHVVVEFDAFETDHHEDAFFSLLTTLLNEIEDDWGSRDTEHGSWRSRIRAAALGVGRSLPGIVASAALPGPLGALLADAVKHAIEHSNDPTHTATDRFLNERIDTIAAERRAVRAFKNELASVTHQISESSRFTSPLVFIIDELDRCKPSFALDVLERMKHVFAADGVCFVLVTHLAELRRMVKHAYGVEAPEQYLHKFYQLKIDIKKLVAKEGTEASSEYILYLCGQFGIPTPSREHTWFITLANLVRLHGLTFRSVERVVRNLAMYVKANRNYAVTQLMDIAAGLCVMREVEPDLYNDAAGGRLTHRQAKEFLQLKEWDIGWARENMARAWQQVTQHNELVAEQQTPTVPQFMRTSDGGDRPVDLSEVVKQLCEDIDLFAQAGR